jgi:glutamyl/glutaminyl-tRNA synthetase
MLNYHYAKMY